MKLESINIKRFRSIENLELTNCGQFNVLIGKNNSGKSNILSAIQAFFACIQSGNVITYEPPIGKEIDFFKKSKPTLPIEIALTFSLTLAERDALIQDIVKEAPQMRNAIEGIDPALLLSVFVSIHSATITSPNYFGYVSKIALINPTNFVATEKILLRIDAEPALELYSQVSRSHRQQNNIATLHRLTRFTESDDWRTTLPDTKTPSRTSVRALLRRYLPLVDVNEDFTRQLETSMTAIGETPSYDDFIRAINALEKRMQEEIATIQEEPLRHKIGTFAGEESSVPIYVLNLIGKISKMKVLYLKEQRKQIGKDEASRLLSLKTRRGGPEVLRNLQETVLALLGVKIDAFESDSVPGTSRTVAELDVDEFLVEVNGSGIREALRLVLDVEFEHPQILLVEEPEIHLHPALETTMMRYLKRTSSERQVFLTTHSTNFLDTAEMKNVYLISKPNSTQVQLLDFEEAESQIPKELGIRLSSLFMFDRLVFIEGKSDAAIIREWASIMGVNLNQSNVGFIPMGGHEILDIMRLKRL
jgi:putative ATP-dependent endonuclease of the OLD family